MNRAHSGIRVLVIDDEPILRTVLVQLLQSSGFDVVAVESGEEAVRLCSEHDWMPAGVVLDWSLHGMDGPSTLAALRCLDPTLPVVISSGIDGKSIPASFLEDCHTKFLEKPYTREKLIDTLDSVIE